MPEFATRLIAWQQAHGRHDLPWQNTRDPYAVWVSEIMLQQTQVAAVIAYYRRFMGSFPDIASLATASEYAVLQHWSGLGYYSRARNLHAAAQQIVEKHGGIFPRNFDDILSLPGIGRSTAAAIAAFCFGQRRAILDGNVKRVLTRSFGIEGWPDQPSVQKQLWELAEHLLPETGIEAYTQGLMDMGATLCTRSKPKCTICPLQEGCIALRENRVGQLPTPKPRKAIPQRQTTMLLLRNGNEILLEKRPPTGIWGGLWSLPEIAVDEDAAQAVHRRYGLSAEPLPALPGLVHSFTHFRLHITPQPMRICGHMPRAEEAGTVWLEIEDAISAAIPTPVRKLLQTL
jgi:A/G-specific adenine glycosylase